MEEWINLEPFKLDQAFSMHPNLIPQMDSNNFDRIME